MVMVNTVVFVASSHPKSSTVRYHQEAQPEGVENKIGYAKKEQGCDCFARFSDVRHARDGY